VKFRLGLVDAIRNKGKFACSYNFSLLLLLSDSEMYLIDGMIFCDVTLTITLHLDPITKITHAKKDFHESRLIRFHCMYLIEKS
jgi:hypothetical protein